MDGTITYVASTLLLIATYLNGKSIKIGWLIGALGSIVWTAWEIDKQLWGASLVSFVFVLVNLNNYFKVVKF